MPARKHWACPGFHGYREKTENRTDPLPSSLGLICQVPSPLLFPDCPTGLQPSHGFWGT